MDTTIKRRMGTVRKTVYFTEDNELLLRQWCDEQGISFSTGVETLAMMALDKADLAFIPVTRDALQRTVANQFNRMAKLILLCLSESTKARFTAETLMLHMIRAAYDDAPEDFKRLLMINAHQRNRRSAAILDMYQDTKKVLEERVVRQIRQPTESFNELIGWVLNAEVADEA